MKLINSMLKKAVIAILLFFIVVNGNYKFVTASNQCPDPSPVTWQGIVNTMDCEAKMPINDLPRALFAVEYTNLVKSFGSVDSGSFKLWDPNSSANPPAIANPIFEIGSMSKQFIATAIFKLMEQRPGNFPQGLDTPVWTIVNMSELGLQDNSCSVNPDWNLKRLITIRHLMQHTSGMRYIEPYNANIVVSSPCPYSQYPPSSNSSYYVGSPGLTNESICDSSTGQWIQARRAGVWKIGQYVMHQRLLDDPNSSTISCGRRVVVPGTIQPSYSNYDYIVLARIIEAVTGSSFNVYIKNNLFAPINMPDSFFMAQTPGIVGVDEKLDESISEAQRNRIADVSLITTQDIITGQRPQPAEVARPLVADYAGRDASWEERRRQWTFAWPEGGMYSTAPDLLTFLRMLKRDGINDSGQRILSSTSVTQLLQLAFGHDTTNLGRGLPQGSNIAEGRFMTFMWITKNSVTGQKSSGVFLSQRLTNVTINDGSRAVGEASINRFTELVSRILY